MNPNTQPAVSSAASRTLTVEVLAAAVLVVLIILSRWTIDVPNFQPVMAIALLAGFLFHRQWLGIVAIISGMLFADAWIGFYEIGLTAVVYLALALPLIGGLLLRRWKQQPFRFVTGMLGFAGLAAVNFYLMTNLAVWAFTDWYPDSAVGLGMALWAGLPFLKWTLLGNLTFTTILMGLPAMGTCSLPWPSRSLHVMKSAAPPATTPVFVR